MTTTESGTIERPARTLADALADLHRLEKERVHHMTYARWRRQALEADAISDAVSDIRTARRRIGSMA